MTLTVHVVPRNDLISHDTADDCICGPDPLFESNGIVARHHSLDGRELREGATMIDLSKNDINGLRKAGIDPDTVVDSRREDEDTVIVVTSAGQKVRLGIAGTEILMGPGFEVPEVVSAPPVVEPETVPAVEDLAPIEPVETTDSTEASGEITGEGSGETLPPVVEKTGDDESTLVQSFDEMKVEQLKGLLRDRGLPVVGKKDELIDRLNAAE